VYPVFLSPTIPSKKERYPIEAGYGGAGGDRVGRVGHAGRRGHGEPVPWGRVPGRVQVGRAPALRHVRRLRPRPVPVQPLVGRRRRGLPDLRRVRQDAVPQLRRVRHGQAAPCSAHRPEPEAAARRIQLITVRRDNISNNSVLSFVPSPSSLASMSSVGPFSIHVWMREMLYKPVDDCSIQALDLVPLL
jgi:hypothetical protein